MNQSEILEACRLSKHFFFEHYYLIPNIQQGGLTPFVLRDFQEEILDDIQKERNIIGLKARQIGWTTLAVANALHDALFNELRPWKFISRNEKAAQDMVTKATIAYYRLPTWMKKTLPKLKSETQGRLEFANMSFIEAEPATGSSFRGDAVHGLLMDECAFMEYAEDIWGAAEAGVYGPRMLFSTANGMGNFFHDIWLDSQRENSAWHSIFYPWQAAETRDQDWYEQKRLEYRGREWQFFQEYPSSPEEAFAKSGRVAYASDILTENFEAIEPAVVYAYDYSTEEVTTISDASRADVPVTIWREPEVVRDDFDRPLWKPNYVVSADIAEGLEHGDFTYVNVFDVNTGEQVASSKSSIPVSYLDGLIEQLGYYYFKALVILERNNAGILAIDRLYRDRHYPRLYRMDRFAEMRLGDRTPRYGWVTSSQSKPKMVNDFLYALTRNEVTLHDPEFLLEAQTFVADGKGSFGATASNHDDVIMGTLVGWQGILDSPKYNILWEDTKVVAPTHDDLDDLFFPKNSNTNANFLETPMGSDRKAKQPKKSVIFTHANYKQNSTV